MLGAAEVELDVVVVVPVVVVVVEVEVVSVLKDDGWNLDAISALLPTILREHRQEFRPAPLDVPSGSGPAPSEGKQP